MRNHVAVTTTFKEAQDLKFVLQGKFPDKTFQVRHKAKGFEVVERIWNPSNPTETLSPSKRRKRRGISI